MHLLTEGQSLSVIQISSTYLNWRLKYNYFRFVKKRPPYSNCTSGFDFGYSTAMACYFASCCRMSSKSDHLQRKYDVISISQNGGRYRQILLPVSYLLMSLFWGGQSLSANHISSTYLIIDGWAVNTSVFLKTNVRHIGILFPVSISITSL